MKIIKLPKGVPPRKAKHGLTHFLRVPFATSISTPLLQKSILEIALDPIAAALPQIAWNNPSQVHFTITALSLKKPDRVNAAAQLLQGLDMNQIADQKNRSMQPAMKIPLSEIKKLWPQGKLLLSLCKAYKTHNERYITHMRRESYAAT
jgi:hypothetical protein